MELVKYPNPILKKQTVEVIDFGEELSRTAEGMLDVMYGCKGLGLAGPQAGLSRKIIVVNPSGKQEDELVLVNPKLLDVAGEVVAVGTPAKTRNEVRNTSANTAAHRTRACMCLTRGKEGAGQ